MDYCEDMKSIIHILKAVIGLVQFGIPIILILFGMIDLGKAVMASKEDEMKAAQKLLIRRAIYAVAVFLIVQIVLLVMGLINQGSESKWYECYKRAATNYVYVID